MISPDHQTLICTSCKKRFCPVCDYPVGIGDVSMTPPIFCGVCLDVNSALHPFAHFMMDRVENYQKRRNETQ